MFVGTRMETATGLTVELAPESIVGRMSRAALRIEDPRISEAHALVSLRGSDLKLLALRGRMSVAGKPVTEVKLTPGLRVVLAGFYPLTCVSVHLPSKIPAIFTPMSEPFPAIGVVAIFPDSEVPLRSGFDPEGPAHLWYSHETAWLRLKDTDGDQRIEMDSTFVVGGATFTLAEVDTSSLGSLATAERGRFDTAMTLHLQYDIVRLTAAHGATQNFDGLLARALCELHAIGKPVAWQELARLVWGPGVADELTEAQLRQRWDQLLTRMRMKLRETGLRSDLIRSARPGLVELVLGPGDKVVDGT